MAEKPRLKETDEIFSSIGKGSPNKAPPLPVLPPDEDEGASLPERQEPPLIDSLVDGGGEPEAPRKPGPAKPGRRRKAPQGKIAGEPEVDARPLDFGKYGLPSREETSREERSAPLEPPALITPPQPKVRRVTPPPQEEASRPSLEMSAPSPASERAPSRPSLEMQAPLPDQRPSRSSRSRPAPAPSAPPSPEPFESRPTAEAPPREPVIYRPPAPEEPLPEIKPFVFEELGGGEEETPAPKPPPLKQKESKPERRRIAKRTSRKTRQEAPQPELKEEAGPSSREPEGLRLEDLSHANEEQRDDFLQELSSQFDQAFNQAFEGKRREERAVIREVAPRRRTRSPYDFEIAPKAEVPKQEEERLPENDPAGQEAESFLREFEQQVREEEEDRTEQFKDTLAEKFERERERYLRELGIGEEPEPEPEEPRFRPPSNRRLDIQIEPEMHRQPEDGKKPREATSSVTYSPHGTVRPLEPEEEEEATWAPPSRPKMERGSGIGDSKTAEELLMELGRQQPAPEVGKRPPPKRMRKVERPEELRFVPVSQPETKEKPKSNKKIIVISAVAAVFLLLLVSLPMLGRMWPVSPTSPDQPGGTVPLPSENSRDITVYETRDFDFQEYDNILIKKAGVTVGNVLVNKHLVIQDISTQGEIVLENITVGEELRIDASGIESLVLRDVSADRLLINNSNANLKVSVAGQGDIRTLEVRTPSTITHELSQGADVGRNIQNVILKSAPEVSVLNVGFHGLDIQTMVAEPGSVVELGNDTQVELLTSQGAISLTGEGRVLKMTAQLQESEDAVMVSLGVPISNLSMSGPGNVVVKNTIDTMVASENLTLTGNGSVSSLVLEPPVSGHRLLVDVMDAGVHTLIANAETTLGVTGSGKVTEVIANQSVYLLGNKVSLLQVNANNVVYEVEPDKLTVRTGIRPPGSVADNPGLDYSLNTVDRPAPADTSLDDVSTTCGHLREIGGFLEGDGSAQNPYQVATPANLGHIQQHLNYHFIQTADIDISDDTAFVSGFPMIGGEGTPFSGSYDGSGYSISSLRINAGGENVGLFAENVGQIRNVTIASGEVRGTSTDRCFVGGIAGLNYQSGVIEACSNGARVVGGEAAYVGGIAGYNYSAKIRDCYNAAKITGVTNVGGLVGVNGDGASLSGSYNVGTIEGGASDTGGVAGVNTTGGIVTNSYYLSETAAAGIGTGNGSAQERDTDTMSSAQMVADLSAGNENTPWRQSGGGYTYPVLEGASADSSSGWQDAEEPPMYPLP